MGKELATVELVQALPHALPEPCIVVQIPFNGLLNVELLAFDS